MNEGKPRALRAVARCASLEEFIAGFARFAEPERLFVITSDPKAPGGPPQQFVIQLADGSTALRGIGEVVEQHLIPTGPEGKCGMWLRLVELTASSREVHRQLLERRARPPVPAPDASGGRTIRLASAPPPVPPPPVPPPPVPLALAQAAVAAVQASPPMPPATPSGANGGSPAAAARPRTPTIRVPAVLPPIAAPRLAREPRTPLTMPEATPPPAPMPRFATAATATPVPPPPTPSIEDHVPPEWESAATTESVFPPPPAPVAEAVALAPVVALEVQVPAPEPAPAPAVPAPSPSTTRDELVEKARRMAGPSPHAEERAPGSPFQLPANPLASLPDEALGYFIECTLFEQTDLAEVDDLVMAPAGVAPAVPMMAAPMAVAAPIVPATTTAPRALIIVAVSSVLLGVGGGWLLFGRGQAATLPTTTAMPTTTATPTPTTPASTTPTPAPAPAAATPTPAPTPITPTGAPAPATAAKQTRPAVAIAPTPTAVPAPAPTTAAPSVPTTAAPSAPTTARPGECLAQVTTAPAGVHVAWGGLDLGDTPVAGASVPCGAADVVLTHPRYERVARSATAKAGTPSTIDVKMQRPTGVVTLRSIPPGATFTINGVASGRGPSTAKVPVWETLHVEATLAGYAPWRGSVKLRAGTGQVFARMTRAR